MWDNNRSSNMCAVCFDATECVCILCITVGLVKFCVVLCGIPVLPSSAACFTFVRFATQMKWQANGSSTPEFVASTEPYQLKR